MINQSKLNYFITWSKQVDACVFEMKSASEDHYIDSSDQIIYDLCSTSYNASFGHSFQPIINAIKGQLDDFPIATPKAIFNLKQSVSTQLLRHLNLLQGKIFYTTNGAESIENALKMARQIKNRKIILAREDSYHGATLGALSVTGDWRNKEHFTVDDWTMRIPSPHDDPTLKKTEEIIKKIGAKNIAAFCLETITGGNGVILASQKWWNGISHLCQKYDLFLILDEVVCGFNRTKKNFAFQNYNIRPDFICMAKGITGGYIPFGALYTSDEIAKYYDKIVLAAGLTNYAHPLGLRALEVVLTQLNSKQLQDHIFNLEKVLESHISQILTINHIIDVRHKGLLMAIEVEKNCTLNFTDFIENGILISHIKNNFIIAPPYIMSEQTLAHCMTTVVKVLRGVSP